MKKYSRIMALLAALVIALVPMFAFAADGTSQSLSPSLILAGFSTDKSSVQAGDTVSLSFKLKNTSSKIDMKNVNIRLSGGEALIVNSGSDSVWTDTIAKGSTYSFSKEFYCSLGAAAGVYPVTVSASFEYFDGGEKLSGTAEINCSVRVTQAASASSSASLTPHIIISDFSYGGNVSGSSVFDLKMTLKNNSKNIAVQNVIVKLSGGEAFIPAEGTDTISIDKITSTKEITQKLKCLGTTQTGIYPVTVSVSYEYFDGGEKQAQSEELMLSIPVVQPEKIEFGSLSLEDTKVALGEEQDCAFTVINSGRSSVFNGRVKLVDAAGRELASAYIGNLEAGDQFASNYTLPVTLTQEGKTALTLVFEYENDSGEAKSVSREFSVTVQQEEDPYAQLQSQNTNTQDNYSDYTVYYILGAAAVVIIAVVAAVVVKRKKSKKKGDELDEEI